MSPATVSSAPAPVRPTVLRTRRSAVLLDRNGDVELTREARGAPVEWGGVYGQLVRLSGPWRLSVESPEGTFALPATLTGSTLENELFESRHRLGSIRATQRLVPLGTEPGALRSLLLENTGSTDLAVDVTSTLSPYLLPVLVEGIRPVTFDLETWENEIRVRHRGFAMALRYTVRPSRLEVDRASWRGGRRKGPIDAIASDHEVTVPGGGTFELRFAVVGGLERDLLAEVRELGEGLIEASDLAGSQVGPEAAWEAATPSLLFPDAPELEAAYRLARTALRRLYAEPGDDLVGLVAGYPWYYALWCRDIAWMLPAVVWLGDRAWAERSIGSILRFQSMSDVPIVGGETGELPMQVAPGPIFLYGTSDTTLYFPALVGRLARHGTDPAQLRAWTAALGRAIAWARRRTDPATGLVRNGGEAAELSAATRSLARVRYGIDAVDTTIWDSTDRRDHAIDVQVLWADALRAVADLAPILPGLGRADEFLAAAERVERSVTTLYRWPEERYLHDSRRAGTAVAKLRPNALRTVSAGWFDADTARAVVRRAAEPDLTTPWGVRTLSSRDPGYSPEAYHDGQVWPIATAWAADAALAAGENDLGLAYLVTLATMFVREDGGANECYRGDSADPFNSCFLLGLSVGPFVSVLFERLWGLDVDARVPRLRVAPAFPSGWHRAGMRQLRLADGMVDLDFQDGRLTVRWSGTRPLRLEVRGQTGTVPPASSVTVSGSA